MMVLLRCLERRKTEVTVAFLPTNAALYYGVDMNPAIAIFFGWVSLKIAEREETQHMYMPSHSICADSKTI